MKKLDKEKGKQESESIKANIVSPSKKKKYHYYGFFKRLFVNVYRTAFRKWSKTEVKYDRIGRHPAVPLHDDPEDDDKTLVINLFSPKPWHKDDKKAIHIIENRNRDAHAIKRIRSRKKEVLIKHNTRIKISKKDEAMFQELVDKHLKNKQKFKKKKQKK